MNKKNTRIILPRTTMSCSSERGLPTHHRVVRGLLLIILLAATLRLYRLPQVPVSLHGDEVGVGYNAYSLLTAGIDEYGQHLPLVFRADVSPIIFYSTVPFVAAFGPTEIAIRLPSVFVGVASIVALYMVVCELLRGQKMFNRTWIALASAGLLAILPWHVQISRIAHDASYGLFIQLLALYAFLRAVRAKTKMWLYASFVLFALSFYGYHGPRLTTPILIAGLLVIFRTYAWQQKAAIARSIALFALIVTPITVDFLTKPIADTRFGGISIFTRADKTVPFDIAYVVRTTGVFMTNYLNQFNPQFLFLDTSGMRYFNVARNGLLYLWQLPFVVFGAIELFRMRKKYTFAPIVLFWLLIAPLPGALTRGDPNAGRIFMLAPMAAVVTIIGVYVAAGYIKKYARAAAAGTALVIIAGFFFFAHSYFILAPQTFFTQWQTGFADMARTAVNTQDKVERIIITEQARQAYIYILFYGRKDPRWLAQLPNKQRHEFIGYRSFDKYHFRTIDWEQDKLLPETLLIGFPHEIPSNAAEVIGEITDPRNHVVFRIAKT